MAEFYVECTNFSHSYSRILTNFIYENFPLMLEWHQTTDTKFFLHFFSGYQITKCRVDEEKFIFAIDFLHYLQTKQISRCRSIVWEETSAQNNNCEVIWARNSTFRCIVCYWMRHWGIKEEKTKLKFSKSERFMCANNVRKEAYRANINEHEWKWGETIYRRSFDKNFILFDRHERFHIGIKGEFSCPRVIIFSLNNERRNFSFINRSRNWLNYLFYRWKVESCINKYLCAKIDIKNQ